MVDVLDALPDEPACVEARGMVLSRRGRVVWRDEAVLVLHASRERLATIVGPFCWASVMPALNDLGPDVEVVTREAEFRGAGPVPAGWIAEGAIVHDEPARHSLPSHTRPVTFFDGTDVPDLRHVPANLRRELEAALAFSPIAAALDGDVPVSFCYSGWETETWWDVSIDTLAPWRNRGFAAAAVEALMAHMRRRGKRAVWAALESNVPSLRVARRLGFTPVGRLAVVRRRCPN
jgi:GNAT superfamily N-acetyltransferase